MAQRSEWLIGKTEVSSDTGVVATMVRQATEAGVAMLQRGGKGDLKTPRGGLPSSGIAPSVPAPVYAPGWISLLHARSSRRSPSTRSIRRAI